MESGRGRNYKTEQENQERNGRSRRNPFTQDGKQHNQRSERQEEIQVDRNVFIQIGIGQVAGDAQAAQLQDRRREERMQGGQVAEDPQQTRQGNHNHQQGLLEKILA